MTKSTSYQVDVSGQAPLSASARALLRRAVKAALRSHDVSEARISLRLVSDEEMASMNESHLGHKGPTDVLTFDLRDDGVDSGVEGDIALCVDTAQRESKNMGHGVEDELALYAVHGVLHLLNYQDKTKAAAAKMHRMEDQILGSLGLGAVYASSRR